jgi:hypothetical protein
MMKIKKRNTENEMRNKKQKGSHGVGFFFHRLPLSPNLMLMMMMMMMMMIALLKMIG